ncbi:MAG: choice-of-anchor tandem repeat NxxGxxAF-containing protein [Planctomycetota bacterium]
MSHSSFRIRAAVAATAFAAAPPALASLDDVVSVVAIEGQTPAGLGESLRSFGLPVLNNLGQSAFVYGTPSKNQQGIALATPTGFANLVSAGQASPDGNGVLQSFEAIEAGQSGFAYQVALNDQNQIAFRGSLGSSNLGGDDNFGLFKTDGSNLQLVAREGQSVPDGNGTFGDFFENIRFNQRGDVAFIVDIENFAPPRNTFMHVFRGDGQALTPIVLSEQPDGDNRIVGPRDLALNDSGAVSYAFDRQIAGTFEQPLGIHDGSGFVQYTSGSAPIGGGLGLAGLTGAEGRTVVNNNGQVAFFATLSGTDGTGMSNSGVFLADENGPQMLVQEGVDFPLDPVFGSVDDLQSLGGSIAINDAGQVAFATSGGIYRIDDSGLTRVLSNGDLALDGNGTYITSNGSVHGYSSIALNDSGQMAFQLTHQTNVPGTLDAIYLYDDTDGLIQVAREGESFLGSTIQDLRFLADNTAGVEGNGFNDAGQIAFRFQLTDGRDGIGLYEANRIVLAGDYDASGQVEQGDLNLVLSNWGVDTAAAGVPTGWLNDLPEGLIDQAELNAVLSNWGAQAAGLGSAVTVPEPTGALAAGVGGLLRCRRRRHG